MSFGAAARGRRDGFVVLVVGDPCPCGSGAVFGECCGPLHDGQPAVTAEQLMRSRYTAFVVGTDQYLADTWHPRTRPADASADPDTLWRGLRIVDAKDGGETASTGIVEFEARWAQRGSAAAGILHERSRFVRFNGRWCYLDGEVSWSTAE